MNQTLKIILASALISAAGLKAVPAIAQEAVAPVEISIVSTADLDLGTRAGQRQLETRLARAARDVCGWASSADLKGRNEVRKCRDDVLADAKAQRAQILAAAIRHEAIVIAAAR